jgi:bifunctional non-homologous end joining protein LigD
MEKKRKLAEPDMRSVYIEDDYALDFWAREFEVSKAKLKAAVLVAGSSATDVKRELKK